MCAVVYCNFLKEVRLGGLGTEGPKAPTLGQYVRVRAPPLNENDLWLLTMNNDNG